MSLKSIGLATAVMVTAMTTGTATVFSAPSAQQPPPFAPPVLSSDPPPASAAGGSTFAASSGEFGSLAQIVVSADLQFSIIHASSSEAGAPSSTAVVIQPALDYFIAPNLSVGGLISYAHGSAATIGDNTWGLEARAGYNLKINEMFSFWPRLGLGYFHGSGQNTAGMDSTAYAITLDIFAPVLWHVAPHLFIGLGPTLRTDLVSSADGNSAGKLTFVGVQSVVGGYFGAP